MSHQQQLFELPNVDDICVGQEYRIRQTSRRVIAIEGSSPNLIIVAEETFFGGQKRIVRDYENQWRRWRSRARLVQGVNA